MKKRYRATFHIPALLVLWFLSAGACAGRFTRNIEEPPAPPSAGDHVVVATVRKGDTFDSLARTYLDDAAKGWWISAFNGIDSLTAGRRVVIPRAPFQPGGLRIDGYQTVPILLYQDIAAVPQRKGTVSLEAFEAQLRYLKTNGFCTISLEQLMPFLEADGQLPPNAVVISFDAIDQNQLDIIYPVLTRNGMTAAFFFATGRIGQGGELTWRRLARLKAEGFSVGLTGVTGKNLTEMKPGETPDTYLKRADDEIAEAARRFRQVFDQAPLYFAYPNGDANDLITALLKKHGYRAAFTRRRGVNPFFVDGFKIRRSLVRGQWDMERFQSQLSTFREAALR